MQDFSDGFAGAIRFFDQLYVLVPYELNKIAFFLVKSVISFEIKNYFILSRYYVQSPVAETNWSTFSSVAMITSSHRQFDSLDLTYI